MSADKDRITEIRIRGMRSIEDITLKFDGLAVLIGENGSGKSTIVEACELLKKVGQGEFARHVYQSHGWPGGLLRWNAKALLLAVRIEGGRGAINYELELGQQGQGIVVESEHLNLGPLPGHAEPLRVIIRNRAMLKVFDQSLSKLVDRAGVGADQPAVSAFGALPPQDAISRVVHALRGIEVHLPFNTIASWSRFDRNAMGLRSTNVVQPATELERFGSNLPNVFNTLKNEYGTAHWEETKEIVRLGIGEDVDDVITRPDPGGGSISLALKLSNWPAIPASILSDGQLAYLAFVAIYRLSAAERSLLVFDEPELHLHPHLIYRVVNMFENIAEKQPVLICTHSNALLDTLRDPSKSTKLCELDERRATRIRSVDKPALDEWLADYAGLGSIRSAGHENSLFLDVEQ